MTPRNTAILSITFLLLALLHLAAAEAKYLDDTTAVNNFFEGVADTQALATRVESIAASYGDDIAEALVKSERGKAALKAAWSAEELNGLGKLLVRNGDVVASRIIQLYGENVLRITSKGISRGVIDINKVSPYDMAKYAKYWTGDPLEVAQAEHQLLKMYKAPDGINTVIGNSGQSISRTAVLKKGIPNSWGYDHIFSYIRPGDTTTRAQQILEKFPSFGNNQGILNKIEETLESGIKVTDSNGDIMKKAFINNEGRSQYFEVRIANTAAPGSINTITPGGLVP